MSGKIVRGLMCAGLAGALALACVPLAQAAGQKPLGAVEQAQAAQMDHENAAVGTTIYAGDSFATDIGGILRMRLGANQLSLMSHSALVVEHEGETRTIEEGKSYNVSLDSGEPPEPPLAAAAAAQHGEGVGTSHPHHGRLIFDAVLVGTAAGVAYCLWGTTESPSGFCH